MMNLNFGRYSFCAVAAFTLLAGCGGGLSPEQPSAMAPSGMGAISPAQMRALGVVGTAPSLLPVKSDHRGSWMAPDAKKAKSLLYVADESGNDVLVYSYPAGKLTGTLTGFATPTGICSNKAGDVFILNGNGTTVVVYAHGGTSPLRTLDLPGYPQLNCTVDPKTGNLALGVIGGSCSNCVAVFANAQGQPTTYTPSGQNGLPGCGYDNRGNLFCDAYGSSGAFELFELPVGGSNFTAVSVSGAAGLVSSSLQWDGKDLAFTAGAGPTLYRIKLSGSTGKVVGSTTLGGAGTVWQSWITHVLGGKKHKGIRVIAPTEGGSGGAEVGYWNYPAGGSPTKTITGASQPDGAALSTKQ
ncbi:MAG TPA: hypothetical protein VGI19_15710 [Candidatus Cybelea sp.]|jgi:hypothetical protein